MNSAETDETAVVPKDKTQDGADRTQSGTFAKGNKLSKGRKKGSKNRSTILREVMQEKTSVKLSKKTPKVLQVVLDAAMGGDLQAAKMILDRTIPIRKASEGEEVANTTVNVTISNLTRENVKEVMGVTVDGTAERED